jgi:hypothetical protein
MQWNQANIENSQFVLQPYTVQGSTRRFNVTSENTFCVVFWKSKGAGGHLCSSSLHHVAVLNVMIMMNVTSEKQGNRRGMCTYMYAAEVCIKWKYYMSCYFIDKPSIGATR